MRAVVAYMRRNPFTVPFVVAGIAAATFLYFRGEANRDHATKDLAGLCQKIEKQSPIKCEKPQPGHHARPAHGGVDTSNGHAPSSQPGHAGNGGAPGGSGGSGNTGGSGGQGGAGGNGNGPSAPPPSSAPGSGVNVSTPQLPIVGQPKVCVSPLIGVNC